MSASRAARQCWALAAGTFREAIRSKAFAAPAVFALTAVLAAPLLPTDGTPEGAVRVAVSASLIAATFFGMLATVTTAALLPAAEKRRKTSYMLATKPVSRPVAFSGRAVGLLMVIAALYAALGILSYLIASVAAFGHRDLPEVREAFVERSLVMPVYETGSLRAPMAGPEGPLALAPGQPAAWRFSLPPRRPGQAFAGRVALGGTDMEAVALRAVNPRTGETQPLDMRRRGELVSFRLQADIIDYVEGETRSPGEVDIVAEARTGAVALSGPWPVSIEVGSFVGLAPGASYTWRFDLSDSPRRAPAFRLTAHREVPTPQELELALSADGRREVKVFELSGRRVNMLEAPMDLLAGEGRVEATLTNRSQFPVRLPVGTGLAYAPATGGLGRGILRWALVEIFKASLVAMATLAAATTLSFPVPALFGGVIAAGGYLVGFVLMLLEELTGGAAALALALGLLLPDFASATLIDSISQGLAVPGASVIATAGGLAARTAVFWVAGAYLATREEVGK